MSASLYTVSHYLRDYDLGPSQPAEDLAWQDAALCAETDPEAFFPEKGGSTLPAKRVCRECPVAAECLEYALEHEDICAWGVWGGVSERERRRLKRGQRAARPALEDYPLCGAGLHRQAPNNVCINLKTGGYDCRPCRNMARVAAAERPPQPEGQAAA